MLSLLFFCFVLCEVELHFQCILLLMEILVDSSSFTSENTRIEPTSFGKNLHIFQRNSGISLQTLHCVKGVRIRSFSGPYSVRMWENKDLKNSE